MKCPYCQAEVQGSGYFCQNCGASLPTQPQPVVEPVAQQPVVEPVQDKPTYNTSNNGNRRKKTSTASTFILILIIIGIFVGIKMFNKDSDEEQDAPVNNTEEKDNKKNNDKEKEPVTENGDFLLYVEDVFTITGKGTIATGRVMNGSIKVGDKVQVLTNDGRKLNSEIGSIEMFREEKEEAKAGDNVGILLKDLERTEVVRGYAVISPNAYEASAYYEAEIQAIDTKDGGRIDPIKDGYSPVMHYADINYNIANVRLLDSESIKPGEDGLVEIDFEGMVVLEKDYEFTILEGGRRVARGTITRAIRTGSEPVKVNTKTVEANFHLNSEEDGGRKNFITDDYRPQIIIDGKETTGIITILNDKYKIEPGEDSAVKIELLGDVSAAVGTTFEVRAGNLKAGYGTVTKVY